MDRGKYIFSYEALETFIGFIHEGVMVCNAQGTIELINEPAVEIFGLSKAEDIVGSPVETILYPNSVDVTTSLVQPYHGNPIQNQAVTFYSDGKQIRCTVSVAAIETLETAELYTVIIFHDVERQESAAQKLQLYADRLEKSNKELDQFAYIVSHDLKAPLRAIMNLSQWLKEDLESVITDDSRKNLEMLQNRAVRMEALITGILAYSKIGRSKIQSDRVDVQELVTDIIESILPPKHISIETSNLPTITAPKIMVYQVLSNLISNAFKYNNKNTGWVKIYAEDQPDFYEFTVEDNGPGIAKEFYDTVFVIFQTLQSRDKIESTGIGLTIVKRIIDENGGKIWIESEVGIGTKFIFQWPKTPVTDTIV